MNELEEIRSRYQRRMEKKESSDFVRFMVNEREKVYGQIMKNEFGDLSKVKFLEIGAGTGFNVRFFLQQGISPDNLHVNELLEERIRIFEKGFPGIKIFPGDARSIEKGGYDVIFQSTVFSSILDLSFRKELAEKMWSLLNPGGIILWYDFIYDNPGNSDVKGVPVKEVKSYFPYAKKFTYKKVTLAPPIGRRVKKLYPSVNTIFPFLRTHIVALIKKMNLPVTFRRVHFWLTAAFMFLLPFGKLFPDRITDEVPLLARLLSVAIILLGLNWILSVFSFRPKVSVSRWSSIGFFLLVYFIHLIGMIFTENIPEGNRDLEVKLSLLLFPLILGINSGFSQKKFFTLLKVFITGNILALAACFVTVIAEYGLKDPGKFFYMELSRFIHPGYFSMYLTFSLIVLVWMFFFKKEFCFPPVITVILAAFLFTGHFFLASKTGIIILFLFLFIGVLIFMVRTKRIFSGSLILLLIGISGFFLVAKVPSVKARFESLYGAFSGETDVHSRESTAVRRVVWQEAFQLALENPGGVGTGDVKDELQKAYVKRDISLAAEKKLNAHNEFLQISIATGIAGLTLLIASWLKGLGYAGRKNAGLYYFFLGLIFLNFLTESMLETQAGVLFYAFFNSFLLFGNADQD